MIPRLVHAGYLFRIATGAAAALSAACGTVCDGPGCDDAFSEAQLAIVDPGGANALVLPEDAASRVDGAAVDGAAWTVAPVAGGVFLGEPEVGRALFLDAAAVDTTAPTAWWASDDGTSGLGTAIRLVGDDLWVGAPGAARGAGEAYVFSVGAGPVGEQALADATLHLTSATPDDRLGDGIFPCPDLGVVLVTAPLFVPPADWSVADPARVPALAGAVFVVPIGATGTARAWDAGAVWWGDTDGAGAGAAVACDRDLDGDGVVDIAIGSPWAASGRGRVHVVSGAAPLSESGSLGDRAWAVLDGAAGEWFGASLAAFESDGVALLAIGAPGWGPSDGDPGVGRVHVFAGSDLGAALPQARAVLEGLRGLPVPEHFGRWLAIADLDGDSAADLVVGAPDHAPQPAGGEVLYGTGRIAAWYAWTASPAAAPRLSISGSRPFQRIGRDLAVFDADADGDDELWLPMRDGGASAPK